MVWKVIEVSASFSAIIQRRGDFQFAVKLSNYDPSLDSIRLGFSEQLLRGSYIFSYPEVIVSNQYSDNQTLLDYAWDNIPTTGGLV